MFFRVLRWRYSCSARLWPSDFCASDFLRTSSMKATIGGLNLTLHATERDGQWVSRAVRDDNGDPFGIECAGATEAEAIARLTRWLEWQREHTDALEALQQAERAYHR